MQRVNLVDHFTIITWFKSMYAQYDQFIAKVYRHVVTQACSRITYINHHYTIRITKYGKSELNRFVYYFNSYLYNFFRFFFFF